MTIGIFKIYYYTMEFEFDPNKCQLNKHKHGIDFVDAQSLWDDPDRIQIPVRTEDEARFMLIGKIGPKHWSAIFTFRGRKMRLISVRRSRVNEVKIYEN